MSAVAILTVPNYDQSTEPASRVAAESRGERQPPIAQAPPGVNHHGPLTQSAPRPPAGYSFTSAPSEMTRVYMVETPPAAEVSAKDLDWLDESEAVVALAGLAAAAKRDWTFGWLRLAPTAKVDDLLAQASPLGVQVVGSAGTLVRAKLPGDEQRLRRVAALSSVDGMGMLPPRLKAPADFVNSVYDAPYQQAPVIITLMANDADGRWDRALRTLGAVVGAFDAEIRAYAANLNAKALDAVLAADFVQAVEPVAIVRAHHDTAVPAMGVDALRRRDGPPGLFSGVGGASVPIGVMDTGLNINHLDIASNRESICGANFVSTEPRAEDDDLWVDEGEHGTHVTGTIAGNGVADPRYAGMAPAVAHIRFAKVLSRYGFGTFIASRRGMDFLARPSSCGGGSITVAVKPLIVNMSLAANSLTFQGRGAEARKLDAMVWAHRQLYVVANSNAHIHGFSNYAAAKNSLSVGAASDDGSLAGFSSHGPTADGRLAPAGRRHRCGAQFRRRRRQPRRLQQLRRHQHGVAHCSRRGGSALDGCRTGLSRAAGTRAGTADGKVPFARRLGWSYRKRSRSATAPASARCKRSTAWAKCRRAPAF